jgi:hypothetical protein
MRLISDLSILLYIYIHYTLTHHMKFYRKFIVSFLSLVMFLWWLFCIAQNYALITLTIQWQGLIIWTPENINLWTLTLWTPKELTFEDFFWIEDLRGSKDGHYTSIQWLVYWWDGEIISWATVEFSTNSGDFTLIWGITEDETFDQDLINYTDITEPKILFYRNNNDSHIWYVNRIWFKPNIRVTVPSGSTGPYTLRLSYTLYDMPVTIQ